MHGLIVDYLGIFDDGTQAIRFDEEGITRVATNITELLESAKNADTPSWLSGLSPTLTRSSASTAGRTPAPAAELGPCKEKR